MEAVATWFTEIISPLFGASSVWRSVVSAVLTLGLIRKPAAVFHLSHRTVSRARLASHFDPACLPDSARSRDRLAPHFVSTRPDLWHAPGQDSDVC